MIVISDNSVLSCLAEIGELDFAFLRLSQTGFPLSAQVVETLRQDLAKRLPPA